VHLKNIKKINAQKYKFQSERAKKELLISFFDMEIKNPDSIIRVEIIN
jgi:hypothetical protein